MNEEQVILDQVVSSPKWLPLVECIQNKAEGDNIIGFCLEEPDVSVNFADPKGANVQVVAKNVIGYDMLGANTTYVDRNGKEKNLYLSVYASESHPKVYPTTLHYKISDFDEEGMSAKTEIKNVPNFNRSKVFAYTKETLALVTSPLLREAIKLYMKITQKENIMVLQRGNSRAILPFPQKLSGALGDIKLNDDIEVVEANEKKKKLSDKEDLKVYETPKNVITSFFGAFQKNGYLSFVSEDISHRVYQFISKNKKLKGIIGETIDKTLAVSENELVEFTTYATEILAYQSMKRYAPDFKIKGLEKEMEDMVLMSKIERFHELIFDELDGFKHEKLRAIFETLDEVAKEGSSKGNYLYCLQDNDERFHNIMGRKVGGKRMVFFDPQIGSAKGFCEAADEKGVGSVIDIHGTDIREDIDVGENAHRVEVIGGVNTSTMGEAFKRVFESKTYQNASQSVISFNNPPYSLDDGIAKDTINLYGSQMMLIGVYPVKMKNFLANSLTSDSILVEVPRGMTGYTDPKTPEAFLVVMGKKRDEDSIEVGEHIRFEKLTSDDPKELEDLLTEHGSRYNYRLGVSALRNMDYHKNQEFKNGNILKEKIRDEVEKTKLLFKNKKFFSNLVEDPSMMSQLDEVTRPTQQAKTEKVFVDTRYFSKTNDYQAYRFDEVINNASLLIHYAKTSPKILDIIESIAKEKEIELPIDRGSISTEKFIVGEKYQGERAKVATKSLGMIKYNFYPNEFDLSKPEANALLLDIIVEIYKKNGRELDEQEILGLKSMMHQAVSLTGKYQNEVSRNSETSENTVSLQQYLVFVDDYGMAIGTEPLNISIFDLYKVLEERNLLNIEDYIEETIMDNDDKLKVVQGFIKNLETVAMKQVSEKNGFESIEDFQKDGLSYLVEQIKFEKTRPLKDEKDKRKKLPEIMHDLAGKYDVDGYIDSFYRTEKKHNFDYVLLPVFQKYLGGYWNVTTPDGKEAFKTSFNWVKEKYLENKKYFFSFAFGGIVTALEEIIAKKYPELDRKELNKTLKEFEEEAREVSSEMEHYDSNKIDMIQRLMNTMFITYPQLKREQNIYIEKGDTERFATKGYDNLYMKWMSDNMELMEHQISEPMNFLALEKHGVKTNFIFKAPRMGKLWIAANIAMSKLFANGDDAELHVQSENIKDMVYQITYRAPMLLPALNVFASKKYHQLDEEAGFKYMYNTEIVYNPIVGTDGLKRQLIGGGSTQERLVKEFSKDVEMLETALIAKYGSKEEVTLEKLLEDNRDSRFAPFLEKALEMGC